MPFPTLYFSSGPVAVLMSGELDGLTNNSRALAGVAFNNSSGYLMGELEFTGGAAQSYGPSGSVSSMTVWFLRCPGVSGTYEDGSSTFEPARTPDIVLPVRSGSVRTARPCRVPPGVSAALLKNDGTGVTLAASGNLLRFAPYTFQQASG